MRVRMIALAILGLAALPILPAEAAIIGVSGGGSIIPAPATLNNTNPFNTAQQGFDELQGVLLVADLNVDAVAHIAAGTVVDSHMIFLNQVSTSSSLLSHTATWTFSGIILGVMSDVNGTLESLSTPILGLPGTAYSVFSNRGLEGADDYTVLGNQITLDMNVTQPGDWVRVVTAAPVPEPGSMLLLGSGIAALALRRRRR